MRLRTRDRTSTLVRDDPAVFQRDDPVSLVEDAVVVRHHKRRDRPGEGREDDRAQKHRQGIVGVMASGMVVIFPIVVRIAVPMATPGRKPRMPRINASSNTMPRKKRGP